MASKTNTWIRRHQCPCGDWKCYVTPDGDSEEPSSSSSSSSAPSSIPQSTPAADAAKNQASVSDSMVSPYVGMIFHSDDDAFEYYATFARKHGFSIRKERSRISPQLGVYKRDFVCYRSGFAPPKKRKPPPPPSPSPQKQKLPGVGGGEHHRDRKSMRCGCDSKMYLSKEVVGGGVSQWFVVQFSNVHNHELLEGDQVRLLPAYRKIREADQERILLLSRAGFPIHRIVKVLESEKGAQGGGQLPFFERDVRNFVQNRKKVVQENDLLLAERREGDAVELLEACKAAREADGGFVYDFTVDEGDRVENVAWSYGDSVRAYEVFGDVVWFDASFRSAAHGLVFGVWLGIDNYGRTIFFGCVLLQDETAQSLSWALQTFLRFMGGRCPRTIITDLDSGIRDAVRTELLATNHVINLGNILSKISSWFYHLLRPRYAEFKFEFDALCRLESTEDFELQWHQMISVFGLGTDKHIDLLYLFRASWAPSYTRGFMLARMATEMYSKSVDTLLKCFFNAQACLRSFFEQVGISANFQNHTCPETQYSSARTYIPIEEHARSILTPFAFNSFQNELSLAAQYAVSEMENGSHLIRHYKKMDAERLVIWVPAEERIHCSCKEFEYSGLLCRHALRVLLTKNYFELPEKYYLDRWRRQRERESSPALCNENGGTQHGNNEWVQEFQCLTESLFAESSVTGERSRYARSELTKEVSRILGEVRNMPETDMGAMDLTVSPNS